MTTLTASFRPYAFYLALFVLLVVHAVGLWGLTYSGRPDYFQSLTPFNLLLSSFLLFLFHRDWNPQFLAFVLITGTVGFAAEVVGVRTGLIFGNYQYGQALGWKLWDVPVLIGLNWLMLTYLCGIMTSNLGIPAVLRVLLAALLMVSLDYLIEPVAMRFDFWSWEDNKVPLINYAGWFVLAILFQVLFQVLRFNKNNALAPWLLLLQVIFFLALNNLHLFPDLHPSIPAFLAF